MKVELTLSLSLFFEQLIYTPPVSHFLSFKERANLSLRVA